jgi:hypothetical protein
MAKKSYIAERADDLKLLIAEVKIKLGCSDAELAEKLTCSCRTLSRYKNDGPDQMPAGTLWLLEKLAGHKL